MQSKKFTRIALYAFFLILFCAYSFAEIMQQGITEIKESANRSDNQVIGLDYFTKEGDKFLNLTGADLAIQSDYILKPEDVINIDIWGELDLHYSLTINKDGYIVIPEVGKVDLKGMTYEDGKKKILNKLADSYSFYIDKKDPGAGKAHVDINLGKTSGVKLYLTGEVVHPGVVFLNGANSSVISAIAAGGGVLKDGSIRNIQITHVDGTKTFFDLYDFLLKGSLLQNSKYLSEGDVIYIPTRKAVVHILGSVVKPGAYEVKEGDTVKSIVDYAGGLSRSASGEIIISIDEDNAHTENKEKKEIKDTYTNLSSHVISDRNIVMAKESFTDKPYSYVEVTGNGVRYNGKLRYEAGLGINDYIVKSGGLYRDAYKNCILETRNEDGAVYFKLLKTPLVSSSDKNEDEVLSPGDKLIINDTKTYFDNNYAFVSGYFEYPQIVTIKPDMKLSDLITMGKPLENGDIENAVFIHDGKSIFINLREIMDHPDSKLNVYLSKFDELIVPKNQLYVDVSGAVWSPGLYPYKNRENTSYYIDLAGGFKDNASKYDIYITSPNGREERGYYWLWLFDPEVKRGAKITVPAK